MTKLSKTKFNTIQAQANISALSSGNVSEHEFLIGKYVLAETDLLEKAAAIKRYEQLPLGKELKAQFRAAEKQYQKLDKVFESKKIKIKFRKFVLSQNSLQ